MAKPDVPGVELRELGLVLTLLRTIRGWNQDDLAKGSGIRNSAISDYERGRKVPELTTLERLLAAMDYPLAAIDLTRSYVTAVRTGINPAWAARDPTREPQPPLDGTRLSWEAAQAAQAIGAGVSRFAASVLGLLARAGNGLPVAGPQPEREVPDPRAPIERGAKP